MFQIYEKTDLLKQKKTKASKVKKKVINQSLTLALLILASILLFSGFTALLMNEMI